MSEQHDVIVIGGGLNGLAAAGLLARAGRRVVVLERRLILGGRVTTEEFAPGFQAPGVLQTVGPLRPRLVRDLGLTKYGYQTRPLDPRVFAPLPDGRSLTLWEKPSRAVESIRRWSARDATKYIEYLTLMARLQQFAEPVLDETPPSLGATDLTELLNFAPLGLRLRMLGKRDMVRAMRLAPTAVADFVKDWFETDLLRAVLAAPALTGLWCGPWSAGTGATLLYHGMEGPPAVPRGGPGAVTKALSLAAQAHGAELRTGAEVATLVLEGGTAVGVRLLDGTVLRAPVVLSTIDPHRTFLGLIPPGDLLPSLRREVRNVRQRGVTARINLALDGLPGFTALKGLKTAEVERHLRGRIHVGADLDALERAFDEIKYGRYSRRPMLEAVIPTLSDPSLAKAGKHVLCLQVHWAPYHLQEGSWDQVRDRFADDAVRTLAEVAPDLPSRILHREILTPLDLERQHGLTEGHIHHGEHSLHQLYFGRPVPSAAQYVTPIPGLWLGGAGAHPGGGTHGANGANAAREILQPAPSRTAVTTGVGAGLALLGAGLAVGAAYRSRRSRNAAGEE